MRKFTDGELNAMLEAMTDLCLDIIDKVNGPPGLVISAWPDPHPEEIREYIDSLPTPTTREALHNVTQNLAQCLCLSKHGEQHTLAFLRRYAEIAVKAYRNGLQIDLTAQ